MHVILRDRELATPMVFPMNEIMDIYIFLHRKNLFMKE